MGKLHELVRHSPSLCLLSLLAEKPHPNWGFSFLVAPARMLTLSKTQRNSQKCRSQPFFGGSAERTAAS